MGQLIDFIRDNWGWLSGPVMATLGGASWLINRRVTRASRKADAAQIQADTLEATVDTLKTGLEVLRGELEDLRAQFSILRRAIREATPDKGRAVFQRERELLEERARGNRE